jgi:hypothetical protein
LLSTITGAAIVSAGARTAGTGIGIGVDNRIIGEERIIFISLL